MTGETAGRLAGKVAVITGGASGMGRAGAELFAREGASVVVADINADGAAEVAAGIVAAGGAALHVGVDVGSAEACTQMAQVAADAFGGIDIVWANAGLAQRYTPISDLTEAEFDRQMTVNAKGPWLTIRQALPLLRARGRGSCIITASLSGLKARGDLSAYQASKGAAVMLAKSLSRELAPDRIRVNAICPGFAQTPMSATFLEGTEGIFEQSLAAVPLGRPVMPEDIAWAGLFLASDEADHITGISLPVDGGTLA